MACYAKIFRDYKKQVTLFVYILCFISVSTTRSDFVDVNIKLSVTFEHLAALAE